MLNPSSSLSAVDVATLKSFLQHPLRPEGTMKFHELQGFLFTVASSPESIQPSEWIPMITNDDHAMYADEQEAQKILGLFMQLYNEINQQVLNRSAELPSHCKFETSILDNFGEKSAIGQWASGFLFGHEWLAELWDGFVPEDLNEELGSSMMILSCFASRQLAEAFVDEINSDRSKEADSTLEEFAEKMQKLFPAALAAYANLGRSIFEAVLESRSTPIDRH